MANLNAVILAAGQGTRMKSAYPKVIHKILGQPMLKYVIDSAGKAGAASIIVVVGFKGEQVIQCLNEDLHYVWQREQLGTGHAVLTAEPVLSGLDGDLLVLYGDTPLLEPDTIKALVAAKRSRGAVAAVLTTEVEDPSGYGRIVRDSRGNIAAIIEDKDATPEQKAIKEVNTGVYCFEIKPLLKALKSLTPGNAQGEYYLTDVFKIFVGQGLPIAAFLTDEAEQVMGPNDRLQLAATENYLKHKINTALMKQGVTVADPDYTYIGPQVKIGRDTVILPGTFIFGNTVIGENCVIGPHSRVQDSIIEDNTEISFSQVNGAHIGPDNSVGPFANIRPGTVSERRVKIGDFVELKNSKIGSGSKVPHLSYIGDAQLGENVNIGAGTITCNYDGVNKHRTTINNGAFIGSNANLVAPVVIGEEATVAAGSTITKNVPDKSLAVCRSRQQIIDDWPSLRKRPRK
ncbi:MAG: bifunctional UDP-N-acetylglucosamine diphosphorylase/glucosamine-1-phosphate N-acetyltransferase GlmU [Firmicutes bacterium]|nr:bifunctional UDP-N-acetylglucosamine diphosphorylase/glucosamine-1-phosphate N-acetyltransferase GlmU [Bacillota bacterium]